MEIRCPYCEIRGGLVTIHRHLIEVHLEMVSTQRDENSEKIYYLVPCPFCGLKYRHQLKPRNRNPRFTEEYRTQIGMVAFDQLLYHVLQKHPEAVGVDPAALDVVLDGETGFS